MSDLVFVPEGYVVICQPWTRKRENWAEELEGFSLHWSREAYDTFMKQQGEGNESTDGVVSSPSGPSYWCRIDYAKLLELKEASDEGKAGRRYISSELPAVLVWN